MSGSKRREVPSGGVEQKQLLERAKKRAKFGQLLNPSGAVLEYVTSQDPAFVENEQLREQYRGFVHVERANEEFHARGLATQVFDAVQLLHARGYLQRDDMANGEQWITMVSDAGLSMRYRRSRLFGHCWDRAECKRKDAREAQEERELREEGEALGVLGDLRCVLQRNADRLCGLGSEDEGCNKLNMCIVRYHPGKAALSVAQVDDLAMEPYFGMGALSVSWHRDSGAVSGSATAVYSVLEQQQQEEEEKHATGDCTPWTLGFKRAWDAETPGLQHVVEHGASYYMLGSFNETHRHCVLLGDAGRYAVPMWNADLENRQSMTAVAKRCVQTKERCVRIGAFVKRWLKMDDAKGNIDTPQGEQCVDGLLLDVEGVLSWQKEAGLDWLCEWNRHGSERQRFFSGDPWLAVMQRVREEWVAVQAEIQIWVECIGNYIVPSAHDTDARLATQLHAHWMAHAAVQSEMGQDAWRKRVAWAASSCGSETWSVVASEEWHAVRASLQWQWEGCMLANAQDLEETIAEWLLDLKSQ